MACPIHRAFYPSLLRAFIHPRNHKAIPQHAPHLEGEGGGFSKSILVFPSHGNIKYKRNFKVDPAPPNSLSRGWRSSVVDDHPKKTNANPRLRLGPTNTNHQPSPQNDWASNATNKLTVCHKCPDSNPLSNAPSPCTNKKVQKHRKGSAKVASPTENRVVHLLCHGWRHV